MVKDILHPNPYKIKLIRASYSITQICDGAPLTQPPISPSYENRYKQLIMRKIKLAKVSGPDIQGPTWIAFGPPLYADDVNNLLLCITRPANPKTDPDDIIGDYQNIHSNNGEQRERLERHQRIPGWQFYEESGRRIMYLLLKSPMHRQVYDKYTSTLTPYFCWRQEDTGNLNLLHLPQTHLAIAQSASILRLDRKQLDNTLGMVMLAALSPQITQLWDRILVHEGIPKEHESLQALVTPWMHKKDLVEGHFLRQLHSIATTRQLN